MTPNGALEFEKPLLLLEQQINELQAQQGRTGRDLSRELRQFRNQLEQMTRRIYSKLTAWETVQVARHPRRPLLPDYINMMVKDFCELHGDRRFADDPAIMTGFGRIGGHKVMLIGHNKGRDTREKIRCNFGCAHPEGYRKALLKMKLAAKFRLPVVSLIDTQGAYPGVGAEERGIAQAIAENLFEMARLPVPIVCVVIGEGGSGGALGIGVGDRVAMLQHAFYSVISPEGCAAILWRTAEKARDAAEALRLTAPELQRLGLIDDIIPEPLGGAHRNPEAAVEAVEQYLTRTLRDLKRIKPENLLQRRYARLRAMGSFFNTLPAAQRPAAPPKSDGQPLRGTLRALAAPLTPEALPRPDRAAAPNLAP